MKSLLRMGLIAKVTVLESIRHRVLNILLLFALVVIGTANFFSEISFDQRIHFVKNFSFGAMTLFGVIMAIVAVAQMVPNEIENRTLFTILSKPVQKFEFVLGKFLGIAFLLLVALGIMVAVFGVVLKLQEITLERQITQAIAETTSLEEKAAGRKALEKIQIEARDPHLLIAFVLVYARWLLVAAVALLISMIATSMLFTVVTTVLIYILGHLQTTIREIGWETTLSMSALTKGIFMVISLLIPDFQTLNGVEAILLGQTPSYFHLLSVLGYLGTYITAIIVIASLLFTSREW